MSDSDLEKASSRPCFPIVDQYMGSILGIELATVEPGRTVVAESTRRLRPELSYGFSQPLCWVWLEDGRSVISVIPGLGRAIRERAAEIQSREAMSQGDWTHAWMDVVNAALIRAGQPPCDRYYPNLILACNGTLVREHQNGDCRQLRGESIPPAEGLRLPAHCFPDGIVYGVIADGLVASVAYAHRIGPLEDRLADLGVETADAYQRRGYAKTVVSAVVAHMARRGGESRYGCSPHNLGSIATARSAGFVPYAVSIYFRALGP